MDKKRTVLAKHNGSLWHPRPKEHCPRILSKAQTFGPATVDSDV